MEADQKTKKEFISTRIATRKPVSKIVKKPWGKFERLMVGGLLFLTIAASILTLTWQKGILVSLKSAFYQVLTSEKTFIIEK